jgi:ABC-2 type transport system ATP-binding protein
MPTIRKLIPDDHDEPLTGVTTTSDGVRVQVRNLTKRFGDVPAVTDLSFTVEPGRVTGFLGPNGAGKSTTLRMILGLIRPTAGDALIGGRRYVELPQPARTVGAALDASSCHPGISARDHLRIYCDMAGLPARRVDEVIEALEMSGFAGRKTGGFSTGMRQRLALATALLGNAPVLLLDEPTNGLDPGGIAWLRRFLRVLADEGRTVLVSSHVLSEVEQMVDRVVVLNGGRLMAEGTLDELAAVTVPTVVVQSPDAGLLAARLADVQTADGRPPRIENTGPGTLRVHGLDAERVADAAAGAGLRVYGLTPYRNDLEKAFLQLTGAERITR